MSKDIRTQEAKLDLVKKFLDYAECADASYALLEPVFEGVVKDKKDERNKRKF
ncbi:diadenosine tetraphosphate hydrolase [Helicobacter sp. MIT 14-3879]|uniref:diadenosine tetraphosphate hydrolase n=1 Tax=Helicobacter sp. MIT 14-3879 TaxID=2040649 RepID=UPI000E1F7746|nr:diadenosine tetraphosphate hydrolase [Helicobacter sp. MIT 14-3879]RDU58962.1 diadenosine tetraphosphate hydrolase [Helicobacter sp. MIT 14-3879]